MVLRLILILMFTVNIAYAQELKTISATEFLGKRPSPERQAIVNFIVRQLDNKKVSQAELDNLWNNEQALREQHLVRFQIVDQKLYADSFDVSCLYFIRLLQYFQDFVQKYKVNDIDFINRTVWKKDTVKKHFYKV